MKRGVASRVAFKCFTGHVQS